MSPSPQEIWAGLSNRCWLVRHSPERTIFMPTKLLNDDGNASMATMIMCSHHAFRRDAACFATALAEGRPADLLADEWTRFRGALHGHHTIEDTAMFPDLRAKHPVLGAAIDKLEAHHHAIDPLLERGDRMFADHDVGGARDVIGTLIALLDEHLAYEEATIVPYLRSANEFPVPPNDEALAMYADGFAWSCTGIAPAVLERLFAMLPAALVERIPAARRAFDERSERIWGYRHTGATHTSEPAL